MVLLSSVHYGHCLARLWDGSRVGIPPPSCHRSFDSHPPLRQVRKWPSTYPLVRKLGGGVYWNHCVRVSVSVCLCVRLPLCPNFFPDDIFWTAPPFLTELVMVVYYHEAERLSEIGLLSSRSIHSDGMYYQTMTVSTIISSKLVVRLQPNLV